MISATPQKILITGNMGYVGSSLVSRLHNNSNNMKIIGFDTGFFSHCLINPSFLPERQIAQQYFGDIRQFPENTLKNIDTIVHLAAISNDPMGNKYEKITMDINFKATIELAKKAKKAGVKNFVFASSCSVYGLSENGERNESSKVNPLTAYAKSKIMAENALKSLASDDFMVTCLRFATACGYSPRLRLDLVLNDFVSSAVIDKKITILSDGTPWRPLINVKDMAQAIIWAINRDLSSGGSFLIINIGSNDWNYKVIELAEAVSAVIPNIEVSINKKAAPDNRSYKVNFDLYKLLAPQYQPQQDLFATISELKEEIVEYKNTYNVKKYNSQFIRLKVLEMLQNQNCLTSNLTWV